MDGWSRWSQSVPPTTLRIRTATAPTWLVRCSGMARRLTVRTQVWPQKPRCTSNRYSIPMAELVDYRVVGGPVRAGVPRRCPHSQQQLGRCDCLHVYGRLERTRSYAAKRRDVLIVIAAGNEGTATHPF